MDLQLFNEFTDRLITVSTAREKLRDLSFFEVLIYNIDS